GTMTCSKKVEKFINDSYKNKIYDEFLEPTMFVKNSKIEKDDLIIWMNFRPDRAVELIGKFYKDGYDVITLMKIRDSIKYPYLIDDLHISNTLGEVLERNNLKQLRIAETEKYNHVTYFFDGGRDLKLKNSDNILVASPKVATYDLKPEMSINEVNEKLLAKLDENIYDVVIVNYANGDMVGHTGNMDAAVQAVEAVDNAVGKLYDKVKEKDGILIITADHGNCEYMIDDDNNIVTTHTTNKVNFVLCNENVTLKDGGLADIAPTILDILNIEKPVDMTGESLIK
ncbi:MAG: alkaline phosphatase family protein, partial [bacterium]|nr:alkaline phosphatase family protein [bacterium]